MVPRVRALSAHNAGTMIHGVANPSAGPAPPATPPRTRREQSAAMDAVALDHEPRRRPLPDRGRMLTQRPAPLVERLRDAHAEAVRLLAGLRQGLRERLPDGKIVDPDERLGRGVADALVEI